MRRCALMLCVLAPLSAAAQPVVVEQLPAPAAAVSPGQITQRGAAADARAAQVHSGRADPRLRQMSDPSQAQGPTQQVRQGPPDRSLRVAAPPPEAVDACEAAAEAKTAPPPGIDCESVLEAMAAARAAEPESRLLAGEAPEEVSVTRRGPVRPSRNLVPDAENIARRLNSGDVQNDPVAQAVGAGFTNPAPEPAPEPTPQTPVIIIPGGTAPPPGGGG